MSRVYLVLLVIVSFGPALAARGQDDQAPSLGDVARQARLTKQQKDAQAANAAAEQVKEGENQANVSNDTSESATAPAKKVSPNSSQAKEESPCTAAKNIQPGKPQKKVITNEDIGAVHNAAGSSPETKADTAEATGADQAVQKNPPDYWTTRILAQKNSIASLKSDIDQLNASIQYAPGNCVEGCVEWNEHQQQKQQQVDTMKAQLEEQQKQLEEMQDEARKQGYGSAVYDP